MQMTGGYPPSGSRVPEADDIKRKNEKVCLEGGKNPHFPSIGSDDPPPGVKNVKIQENSEKNQGTSTNIFRFLKARGPSAAARQARGPKIGEKCNYGLVCYLLLKFF